MVKTAGVASARDLFGMLQRSGLLAEAALSQAEALVASSDDPRSLAKQLVARSLVTKWQASQLLNGFFQFNLGKYRLLDQIGVGRIGREFLAEHLQLGKRMAIKLVSRALTADPARLKQFLADARRAGSLDHPHLVHSYDVDQEGQRYYVVTEFVDGEDLNRRVKGQGALSTTDAVRFAIQAAEGLAHAWAHGVPHGDMKPSNLLLDKQEAVKVADLGFARLVDGAPNAQSARDSQEQNLEDGLEYIAPEALNHIEGDLDFRADVYSLGQTLYYLLTAAAPPTPAARFADRSAALLTKQRGISPQIAEVYAKLAAPQASERPASWSEVLILLKEVEANSPAAEPSPISQQTAAPPPVKRKPPVAKAIAVEEGETAPVAASSPKASSSKTPSDTSSIADDEPTVAMAAFAINTGDGPRGKGTKKASSAAATKSATGESATPAASTDAGDNEPKPRPAKKKIDSRLAIGIAIGGGVLMLLIAAGVVFALMQGGEDVVAVKPDENESAKTTDSGAGVKKVSSETKPLIDENPAPPPDENPAPPADENPQPPKEDPVATPPVDSSDKPPVDPPAPEPMPVPMPDVKPEVKPGPPPEVKPEVKPMPAGNPFEKLPAVVSLPDPAGPEKSAVLGEVVVSGDRLLLISLQGGESANRAKQTFTLQNANAGTDPRNWDVALAGKAGDAETIVAKLHLADNKLAFEWTPEAAGQASAATLGNCLLQLTSGASAKSVSLRAPVEKEPEALDFEKGSTFKFAIENAPLAESIRVELVGLDPEKFPNPEFKPERAVSAAKGVSYVWFGGADSRNLGLKIEASDRGKSVEVKLSPFFRIDAQAKETRLVKGMLPKFGIQLDQQLKLLTAGSDALGKSTLSAEIKEQRKSLIEQQMKDMQAKLAQITKAIELQSGIHKQGLIHVRVSYDTGLGKVILAQTTGAPPPEDPNKKKEEKKEEKK